VPKEYFKQLKPLNMPNVGASAVHTGQAQNDHSFDLIFQTIAPEIEIITLSVI
jgi:hypothetical protein